MGNGVLADLQRGNASASLVEKAKPADASAVAAKGSDLVQIKAAARQVATLTQGIAQAQ